MEPIDPAVEGRNETPLERCDRNLAELMQEVRVAQTGVQVLFGFLLTVPFTARFHDVTPTERAVYFITLMLAGAAAMLLIAPTSQHRLLFRCGDKQRLVIIANRYAIAGLAAVAATMVGAVLLVSLLVIGSLGAALASAAAALSCGWCWYGEPLRRRRALTRTPTPSPPQAASGQRPAEQDHSWGTGVRAAG
jgi:Family of unknown function (DUF6328)